jgi:hypothetical protein
MFEINKTVGWAIKSIGKYDSEAPETRLAKAQGFLHHSEDSGDIDLQRIKAASAIIRETGVSLMKVAARLAQAVKDSEAYRKE